MVASPGLVEPRGGASMPRAPPAPVSSMAGWRGHPSTPMPCLATLRCQVCGCPPCRPGHRNRDHGLAMNACPGSPRVSVTHGHEHQPEECLSMTYGGAHGGCAGDGWRTAWHKGTMLRCCGFLMVGSCGHSWAPRCAKHPGHPLGEGGEPLAKRARTWWRARLVGASERGPVTTGGRG